MSLMKGMDLDIPYLKSIYIQCKNINNNGLNDIQDDKI